MFPCYSRPAPYAGDSGADYTNSPGTQVQLLRAGRAIYSEGLRRGDKRHTPWVPDALGPDGQWHRTDTPGCILVELEVPFEYQGKTWRYLWHAHLSVLTYHIRDGLDAPTHLPVGAMLGRTGIGRGVPHLHFGILTDRAQAEGEYMDPFTVERVVATGLLASH